MKKVCANCFKDTVARYFICVHGDLGDCEFCGSRRRKVTSAHTLWPLFEELLALYQPYQPMSSDSLGEGESLACCLGEWNLFSDEIDEEAQNLILDEIRGVDPRDGSTYSADWWEAKDDAWYVNPLRDRWSWFADHLKRRQRFLIQDDPLGEIIRPEKWVPRLLKEAHAIRTLKKRTSLYRGRLGFAERPSPNTGRAPLSPRLMGAPPPVLARAGRANPVGIPVLYCALETETAIIEAGRFPGAVVSVRELRARKKLRLADLTYDRSPLEPLGTPNLAKEIQERTLLGSLGDALGRPIHPDDSQIEYLPTQYLAEVIQSEGYDGICYPSALNPKGTNVVIFDPADVRITDRGNVYDLGFAQYSIHPNPSRQ